MTANRALRTFLRSKTGVAGAALVVLFVGAALAAPWLAPYAPGAQVPGAESQGPSWRHPLGTTPLGEDVLARILFGARTSLEIGLYSVGVSALFGVALGTLAGYTGGRTDTVVMRGIDVLMALPSILLAITIVSILGRSLSNIMIAVGIVGIPVFARQVRASVLSVREHEYVTASRALGAGHLRLLARHILPNAAGPIIVLVTLRMATAILESAGLNFLGLGGEVTRPEWGKMLQENRANFSLLPHTVLAPGIAISATVLAFNLFGDALRDALDPRLR